MSTPSTAVASHPPHQCWSHHQSYNSGLTAFPLNSPLTNGYRVANSHSNGYPPSRVESNEMKPGPRHSKSSIDMAASSTTSGSKRKPDWAEFYKNGMPKEIIVIDDDSPEPSGSASKASTVGRVSGVNGDVGSAKKKRKLNNSATYEPVYQQHTSYSTTQTPYADNSSSHNTVSTDRTTSGPMTAATSLGSQASNTGYGKEHEEAVAGQKRKRTRQAAMDEALKEAMLKDAKRRFPARPRSPYNNYAAPPRPPIKAKDVYVQVVHDRSHLKSQPCDDDDGHYIVNPDSDLTERYQILKLLGQGTFGKVVEAWDRKRKTKCAIKVIRSVQKYRDASRIELRVLSTLASNDKQNSNRCIHLRDCFDFRNHICIVTDLYGQSVFDFLKANAFTPFPSTHIQEFARQLFTSVAFLHDLNLIHTDLKPENILLVRNEYQTFTYNRTIPSSSSTTARSARHRKVLLDPEIRLIDFGSATFNDEYHSSVVSTRHYRAPEIILNLGWSFPCDIWSIGCILVEFFTGDALFQTHDNLEHLAMMEPICNAKLDKDMVRQVSRSEKGHSRNSASQYFKSGKLDYPNPDTPRASRKYVRAMKKLPDTIPPHTEFNKLFLDLLRKIFVYNPKHRITAHEALRHPWFREGLNDDGTEAQRIGFEKLQARMNKDREQARKATASIR